MDELLLSSNALTSLRPRDFRVCYDGDNGSNQSTDNTGDARRKPSGVAPVDFIYSIKSDISLSLLSLREKEVILESVSSAIIESVYKYGCFPRRGRKRRRQSAVSLSPLPSASSSRRAEILSISPGKGHQWIGECSGLLANNSSDVKNGLFCSEIQGTVVIAFDGNDHPESASGTASDFESVGNLVLSRIEEDMIDGSYVEKVNNDMQKFGLSISNMTYIDSDYPNLVAQDAFGSMNSNFGLPKANVVPAETFNMPLFSKVAIPVMVVLFFLAMGLCWCAIMSYPADLYSVKGKKGKFIDQEHEYKNSRNYRHSKPSQDAETGDSITKNNNSKTHVVGSNEKYKREGCEENVRAISLATLQDLSNTEKLNYGDQDAVSSMNSRDRSSNRRNLSTPHVLNTETSHGASRLPSIRARPQSAMHVVNGKSHPSDTETGSSGKCNEIHNNMKDHTPTESKVQSMNVGDRGEFADNLAFAKKAKQNCTPRSILSSLFCRDLSSDVPSDPVPTIDLMGRINSCTSDQNNNCFGSDQGQTPSRVINESSNNSRALRHAIPNTERCNSLMDTESLTPPVTSETTQTTKGLALSRMGTKKSAAYREYINNKMLQRNADCEQLNESIPIEIGVKRTFTDADGCIREMVAL